MRARRAARLLLAVMLAVATSGCLGTFVEAPSPSTVSYSTLNVHLIAAPAVIEADACTLGLAEVNTWVPLWGLAVGILTFGIVVPEWTVYTCVAP